MLNAYRYATGEPGAASPAAVFGAVAVVPPLKRINGHVYDFGNMLAIDNIEARPWIFGEILMARVVTMLIGASGAGKSSFLRLLNRLDEPTGGTIRLDGRDYRELAPRDLRRRVGMVMQSANLFPGTVAANVGFGPLQRGETLLPGQIDALLERVGLAGYQERDVSNLSGGEAQRVSLARTMANAPQTLLLDWDCQGEECPG